MNVWKMCRLSGLKIILIFCLLELCKQTAAVSPYEAEAKKFINDASARYYKLYDQIAQETYSQVDDEDFDAVFSKMTTVKRIAKELVEISEAAAAYDLSKIEDAEIKYALQFFHKVAGLFVLGEEYFSSVLLNLSALKELSTDKDIEPYLGGANMPDQSDSPLAYYPDIQKIFQSSTDADELKYYWETWREKNLVWSMVNFYTIVEAFQKAAKNLDVPVLELWYRYYNNQNFLKEMEKVMVELKPSYQQLHAFARKELLKKYGDETINANGPIPDHLFQQIVEQAWTPGSIIENYFPHTELPPYNDFVNKFDAKELIDEAERFYTSLGFKPLNEEFHKNQLKEHDESANTGDCRADIFDLTPNVFMKYCNKVEFKKFMQNHGYISRIHFAEEKKNLPSYYFNSYDLEYPAGEAVILSASTPKHFKVIGLAENFEFTNKTLMNRLFRMGIHTIFNIPRYFVHTKIMNDLLTGNIEMDSVNKHYWRLMEQYAGVEPPMDRSEGAIDFPYKFYLDIEQNHQTKKFVSEILGYQFYRAFCKKTDDKVILHNCDFYGNLAVGNDLRAMMALGSSKSWLDVLSKILPNKAELSADALLEYYRPIFNWVKDKNLEHKVKIGWNATKKKIL